MRVFNILFGCLFLIIFTSNASARENWGYVESIDSIDSEIVASLENSSATVRYYRRDLAVNQPWCAGCR